MHCLAEKGGRNTAIRVKRGSFEGGHVVQLGNMMKIMLCRYFIMIVGNRKFSKLRRGK